MKPYRFKALLLVMLSLAGFAAQAQTSPAWVWAKHDSLGYEPKCMTIDGSGNVYVAYKYIFTKYDASGNILWRIPFGTQGVDVTGVATDPIGNIYLSGYFGIPALIDTIPITSRGQKDIFLAKFNANGKVFWVRTAGGTGNPAWMPGSIDDAAFALAVDSAGNSYIAGKIHSLGTSVYFDSVTIPPFNGSSFGAKYDTNGKIKWVWMLGIQPHESMKVALGPQGSVYYSVWPSLSKFNADGSVAWYRPLNAQAQINGLGVDNAGNCFISGGFTGTFNFGSTTLTAPSGIFPSAIYLAKYDAGGNPVWATQSTGGSVTHENLTLDQQGNPHISGSTSGNVSFGPNFMVSTGNEDALVMKFHALNGAPGWAQTGGSSGIDVGKCLNVLPNGDCIVTGTFHRAATFGNYTVQPSQTTYANNVFLAKLSMNPLGVGKGALAQNLQLYPNPAASEVRVSAKELGAFRLQAFTLTGQLVFEGNFQQEARLQVQDWPAGLYMLQLTGSSGTVTRKFAIVR